MARGGRFTMTVDGRSFNKALEVLISRVERGTKRATIAACEEIKAMSLEQVPEETGTLASTFDYRIIGSYRNFTAELGYGITKDAINPKQKVPASEYMVAVHEDLQAEHTKGKAKFLEDPIRAYQEKYAARAALIIKEDSGM